LLLASSPGRVQALTQAATHAAALGIPFEQPSGTDVGRLAPGLHVDDIQKAVFSPGDGCILQPAGPAFAYAELAARSGVSIMEEVEILEIAREPDGFVLRSGDHRCHAEHVVIATNAFAGPILERLGVRLPSYPYPRHVFSLAPAPAELRLEMPIVVFQDEDLMLRHDGQMITLVCGMQEQSTLDPHLDPERLGIVRERLSRRVATRNAMVSHIWSGVRAMTPDRRALIGLVPGFESMWCAIGFSGHGIMHAPAIGLAIAEWICTGRSQRFDLTALAPDRLGPVTGPAPVLVPGHA
jgi:sarcosine oxidase subunit beta